MHIGDKKLIDPQIYGWLKIKGISSLEKQITECRKCPRLVEFRTEVASRSNRFSGEEYWSRGVPGFGDIDGKLLILGLAPAATGANRTGRIFTGDRSSEFLVSCLHEAGITNQPESVSRDDGLQYYDSFITAVLKCVPPQDKPTRDELKTCSDYLKEEMEHMKNLRAILVLGRVAYESVIKHFKDSGTDTSGAAFANGSYYDIGNIRLYTSYHPSPRNVNTKRMVRSEFIEFLTGMKVFLDSV